MAIEMVPGIQPPLFRYTDLTPPKDAVQVETPYGEQMIVDLTTITSLAQVPQIAGGSFWYLTRHLGKHHADSFPITDQSAAKLAIFKKDRPTGKHVPGVSN